MKRVPALRFLAPTLFRRRALSCAVSLSLLTPIGIHAVQAQGAPANASGQASQRSRLAGRLDSLTRDALSRIPVASVSVIVIHGQDTLIRRAYGQAELNFGVAATPATLYRLIGPGTTLLAAAVLRAAEQGRLALSDDASKYFPEFPWQGRRVTIRQLLDATSGLQDYHYLGDAYFRVARTPIRTDEVTALFAGQPFVHEPGAAYSWTISGFHMAGIILERVTGEPYKDYLQREVLTPAGLAGIVPCDNALVTPGLARGYNSSADGTFSTDVVPTVTA
ncbi:MAG: beta-lactamase family protein, partial [Gemmatimonadota bacterium]|nr:beta-lactamase family protein [Gemmatimonadota bacterium]